MAPAAPSPPSPPALQEATKNSTTVWQAHLASLFRLAKDRFPDVVWELTNEEEGEDQKVEEVWGHKAIVYARAPPSFQTRYFSFRPNPIAPSPLPYNRSSSPTNSLPTTSALSLSLGTNGFGTGLGLDIPGISRSPSPYRAASPAPSTAPGALLRICTSINPALFSNELEYLYTGQGFGEAFEFLFDASSGEGGGLLAGGHDTEGDAEEMRIDKLRKDLVFMWRSRLYSDVRIALTGNFSSSGGGHENTTAIFSSHRFILVSRSPYFHTALVSWPGPGNAGGVHGKGGEAGQAIILKQPSNEPLTVNLPSPPFTPASLHFTLGFIYTGTLVFSHRSYDLDTAFAIMRSARYLDLDTLYDEIQARIIQEMAHGLFHAFLEFGEYEKVTSGRWGVGGCRCRQCARRAPRVLEFSVAPDVNNQVLERGARRALVGLFGEGWCTQEFAALPQKMREALLKGVGKRTTPGNVFALLFAAEHALQKLNPIIDPWADTVREMVLLGRKALDECICGESERCFGEREWVEIMEEDGARFEDGERVEWIMAAVVRGVSERNAGVLYQTLVSSILLRPHQTEVNAPMLTSTSHIRVQVEQARMDLLRWIGKRWISIRQEGGFDELEGWALKEISDNIEVSLDDLCMPPTRGTPSKSGLKPSLASKTDGDSDALSMHSLRTSVLSRGMPRRGVTPTHGREATVTSSAASVRSVARSTFSTTSHVSTSTAGPTAPRRVHLKNSNVDMRPDSKLTPDSSSRATSRSRETTPSPTSSRQPSIIEPGMHGDEREDEDDDEAESTQARSTTPSKPLPKTLVTRIVTSPGPGSSVGGRRSVVSQRTSVTSSMASLRPRSSASSVTGSVRSHASTIRKSSGGSTHTASTHTASLKPPLPNQGSSRPMSNASTVSTTSVTSDGSATATFRTANTAVSRSRRTSAASTTSTSGLSVRTSTATSGPASSTSPLPSPVRPRRPSTGSTTSVARSIKRPPVPVADPNKLSPAAAVKRPTSVASSVRSVSSMSTTGAGRKVLVTAVKKPIMPVASAEKEKKVLVTKKSFGNLSTTGSSPIENSPSAITIKGKTRAGVVAKGDHKKNGSNASTGSTTTLKRKGSADTITTARGKTAAKRTPATAIAGLPKNAKNGSQPPVTTPLTEPLTLGAPRGDTLDIGIACIISSKRKRFKAFARYIGEVEGESGPWVGVEVPVGESWANDRDGEGRQWHDGTWGGIRYFEIGGTGSEWEYGDDRAARRRRVDWGTSSGTGKGFLKREGDQLSVERAKRVRSSSPGLSDASTAESRGLFVRPQQVLYVVDAVGSDL